MRVSWIEVRRKQDGRPVRIRADAIKGVVLQTDIPQPVLMIVIDNVNVPVEIVCDFDKFNDYLAAALGVSNIAVHVVPKWIPPKAAPEAATNDGPKKTQKGERLESQGALPAPSAVKMGKAKPEQLQTDTGTEIPE